MRISQTHVRARAMPVNVEVKARLSDREKTVSVARDLSGSEGILEIHMNSRNAYLCRFIAGTRRHLFRRCKREVEGDSYICCFRQLVIQMTCVCLLLVTSGGGATSPAHPLP